MSLIPEFKKEEKKESKREEIPGLRKAIGILAVFAGIFYFIGYLSITVSYLSAAGLGVELLINEMGATAPLSLYILFIAPFVIAFLTFMLGLLSLMAGVRSYSRSPGSTIRSGAIAWSLLMLVYLAMIVLGYLGLPSEYKTQIRVSEELIGIGLIGFLLFLVGAVLVNVRVGLTRFLTGSMLVLAGLILVLVSAIEAHGVSALLRSNVQLSGNLGSVKYLAGFNESLLLVHPYILLALLVGGIAVLLAPFLGHKNLWVTVLLGGIGGVLGLVIHFYYSIMFLKPIWKLWDAVSRYGFLGAKHPLVLKTIVLTQLTSTLSILVASLLGIIASILLIVYVLGRQERLFKIEPGESVEESHTREEYVSDEENTGGEEPSDIIPTT